MMDEFPISAMAAKGKREGASCIYELISENHKYVRTKKNVVSFPLKKRTFTVICRVSLFVINRSGFREKILSIRLL